VIAAGAARRQRITLPANMPCRSVYIALALLALSLQGCMAVRPKPPDQSNAEPAAIIYVVRRAWHIDIGFAASELAPPLSSLADGFPGVNFLLFGFGDRRYLQSRSRRLPNMLGALWPGPGLLLMTALAATPAQAFGAREVIALPVTAQQLHAAQASVWASVSRRDGVALSDGPGPYDASAYWRANPRYSAFHTCNTWVAEVLKAAGLPIHSTGVILAGQLWEQTRRLGPVD
jgi:hypothetical protein